MIIEFGPITRKITRVKWQGRHYVVISENDKIVSVTHNGFRAKGKTRERVISEWRKQLHLAA
jgi:hypothetical protein